MGLLYPCVHNIHLIKWVVRGPGVLSIHHGPKGAYNFSSSISCHNISLQHDQLWFRVFSDVTYWYCLEDKHLEASLGKSGKSSSSFFLETIFRMESKVLSPDNFIKMIWIALRVESKVPATWLEVARKIRAGELERYW